MGRKNLLTGLDLEQLTAVNTESRPAGEGRASQPTLGSRGAVGAMSRSLEMISAERDAAKTLSMQVAAGQSVIEVDPTLIVPSIVQDRMNDFDHDHSALVTSIKASGQLVPVLLRPHPQEKGRYQTAYGHRRVRALAELGLPVRAVVRDLSDDELVVAQGKENSDRRDLSFIERASYALALEDRGFGRDVIMSALGVDKTELSRLISISKALPGDLVRAIGPAPKAGRRRWSELAEKLSGRQSEKVIQETMSLNSFKSSGTDERFALLLGALATPKPKHLSTRWSSDDGKTGVVQIDRRSEKTILAVDETKAPMFGEFLISRLPELYQAFRTERGVE